MYKELWELRAKSMEVWLHLLSASSPTTVIELLLGVSCALGSLIELGWAERNGWKICTQTGVMSGKFGPVISPQPHPPTWHSLQPKQVVF